MKKVLQIGGGILIKRGVEKYIENINTQTNHKKIQIDVLTPFYCLNDELRENIENNGGKVIELKCASNSKLGFYISFLFRLNRILESEQYDVIEAQTGRKVCGGN